MKLSYNDQFFNSSDPRWQFLAEYSLSELIAGTDLNDGLVAKALDAFIGDLGVPQEYLHDIERTLGGFVRQAAARFDRGKSVAPVTIRIYYHKHTQEDGNMESPASQYPAQQKNIPTQAIHHSDFDMKGAWGYFLVERSPVFMSDASAGIQPLVDLYLYKEVG